MFDEGESILSQLEDDSATQYDLDEDEYVKREAEINDEIVDGGWLEGDDIEEF